MAGLGGYKGFEVDYEWVDNVLVSDSGYRSHAALRRLPRPAAGDPDDGDA